jgi:ubiquinone/menaquinone biosynthesis C-methylase UbiE
MQKRSHESIVSQQFSPQAQSYLASAVHAQGEDLVKLADILGKRPQDLALDLGCGGGHVSFLLAGLVHQVVAYDLSEAMVAMVRSEAIRRELGNLEARQGSVERLPFADQSFDIVVSRYSAHHWHDIAAGLREARRVLRPGGIAVFMDVVAPDSVLLDSWLQSLELLRDPSHVRDYSIAEWHAMLTDAGFRPDEISRFRIRLEFSSWIERMKTPVSHVQAIRSLQSFAGTEVNQHFEMEADGSFTLDTMLISAAG